MAITPRQTPEQANFRRNPVGKQRCGGYAPFQPCSMFLPYGNMLQGTCSAVAVPQNTTDDEHTCDLWEQRTEAADQADDATGYYDGDADDVAASMANRRRMRILDMHHNPEGI
jgi:hypothetical protein